MTELTYGWDIYYRLPTCVDWTIHGYTLFQKGIRTAEEIAYILSNMNEYMGVGCLWFIMKEGILPIWECAQNIDGGVFAFSISNVAEWKNVVYAMCGNTLFASDVPHADLNGISLLPKKGALVFKLWFRNDKLQTVKDMTPIPSISPANTYFQYHHVPTAIAVPKHRPASSRPVPDEKRRDKSGWNRTTSEHRDSGQGRGRGRGRGGGTERGGRPGETMHKDWRAVSKEGGHTTY